MSGSSRGLIAAMRPKQWTKNLLVVAAPLAAGRLADTDVLRGTAIALVAMVMISSAVYLFNDIVDRDHDANHPDKRNRPIASGSVHPRIAGFASVVLAASAIGLSAVLGSPVLGGVVVAYLVISTSYSLWLKHQPLIDILTIAAGFLLRALAGGAATGIAISTLFLITATAGALFVAAGKRSSELVNSSRVTGVTTVTRPSLQHYTVEYLRSVWTIMAAVAMMGAALWALEVAGGAEHPALARASIAPFTVLLLRYAWRVERGEAEAPEVVVARDGVLLASVLMWAVLLGVGVGLGG